MSDYRATFLGATDPTAYAAIRHKVTGEIEPLFSMKAGSGVDNTLQADAGRIYNADLNMSPKLA